MLRRTALAFAALALALVASPPLFSQQTSLTVLSKDNLNNIVRRAIATTSVGEQEYVALDDLAAMFQLTVREEPGGMLAVTYKGKTILLTQDQPLGSSAAASSRCRRRRFATAAGWCRWTSSAARSRSSTTRRSRSAVRRGSSSSATCACRACRFATTLRQGAHRAPHHRRDAASGQQRSCRTAINSRQIRRGRDRLFAPRRRSPARGAGTDRASGSSTPSRWRSPSARDSAASRSRGRRRTRRCGRRSTSRRAPLRDSRRRSRNRAARCFSALPSAGSVTIRRSSSIPATAATTRARRARTARKKRTSRWPSRRKLKSRARNEARRPGPAHPRRRPERGDRRSNGGRQQRQGGSVHQPARQRVVASGARGRDDFDGALRTPGRTGRARAAAGARAGHRRRAA